MALHIPSPPADGFHIGPAYIHAYGLMYVIGIALAIWITRRRWRAAGGDPALVSDVALWAVPAGSSAGGSTSTSPPRWTSTRLVRGVRGLVRRAGQLGRGGGGRGGWDLAGAPGRVPTRRGLLTR